MHDESSQSSEHIFRNLGLMSIGRAALDFIRQRLVASEEGSGRQTVVPQRRYCDHRETFE
jgi:hypothetical protein